jgi:hypothetical protein
MATDAPASECWLLDAGLPGAVSHVAAGRFRGQGSLDVALVSARHVQLLGDAPGHGPRRRLDRVCVHQVHAPIRDAKTVPHSQADQVRRPRSAGQAPHDRRRHGPHGSAGPPAGGSPP